ncbi:hypothetical protein [Gimesia sp.]|uniref:hypothetical protein n=1 Tax=Gimesia sp. TaxID=2024833 RepID=UPI003A931F3C
MLRGCLFALFFWLAVAGGYWYWFDQIYDPPGSIIGAVCVGLITTLCLGSIMNARTALRDWSLATASRNGIRLEDGRLIAVGGTIHPVDQPLIAPFSGRECVICEYDIGRPGSQNRSQSGENPTPSDYAGFLMTPSAIHTPQGEVRLLGFPILEDIPDEVCHGFDAARNGFEFLTKTEFENRTGLKMVTIFSVFGELWSDDDGLVQKNMQLRNVQPEELFTRDLFEQLLQQKQNAEAHQDTDAEEPSRYQEGYPDQTFYQDETRESEELAEQEDDTVDEDFASDDLAFSYSSLPKMTEKRIDVGEPVCVIGKYNELRQGLLPAPGSTQPNRLIRGTLESLEKKSRSSLYSRLLGGLLVLIIVNAAAYGVTYLYQHSPDTIRHQRQEAIQAINQDDEAKLKALLHRGLDPNFKDQNGQTLLDHAREMHRDNMTNILRNAGARE